MMDFLEERSIIKKPDTLIGSSRVQKNGFRKDCVHGGIK